MATEYPDPITQAMLPAWPALSDDQIQQDIDVCEREIVSEMEFRERHRKLAAVATGQIEGRIELVRFLKRILSARQSLLPPSSPSPKVPA